MKKIVALALCLIMALSLATVAFGTPVTELVAGTMYVYDADGNVTDGVPATFKKAVAPTSTKVGNIAYYVDGDDNFYVACDADDDDCEYAFYNGTKLITCKEAVAVFYNDNTSYVFAYTSSASCGQYGAKGVDVFTKTDKAGNVTYYYAVDGDAEINTSAVQFLYKGDIIAMDEVDDDVAPHNWDVATTDASSGAALTEICTKCGAKAKVVTQADYLLAKEAVRDTDDEGNFLVITSAASTTTTTGVTSAKTFDAGVALYAGMALMSVAGSAVVIGKKKEF